MTARLTLITRPPIEDELFGMANGNKADLMALRDRVENEDGEETLRPPSVEQMRSFLAGLAKGVAFSRNELGSNYMPKEIHWVDTAPSGELMAWHQRDGSLIVSRGLCVAYPPILFRENQAEREDHFGFINTLGHRVGFLLASIPEILSSMACWGSANQRGHQRTRVEHLAATVRAFEIPGAEGSRVVSGNGFVHPHARLSSSQLAELIQEQPKLVGM